MGKAESSRHRSLRHSAGVAALSVLAAVPPVALLANVLAGADASPGQPLTPGVSATAPVAATAAGVDQEAPRQAAQWLREHLLGATLLVTDGAFAGELAAAGVQSDRLRAYGGDVGLQLPAGSAAAGSAGSAPTGPAGGSAGADSAAGAVVIATPALRAAAADRAEDAALGALPLLARFGPDDAGIQVRRLASTAGSADAGPARAAAPSPSGATGDAARQRELEAVEGQQRKAVGELLSRNPRLRLADDDRTLLSRGEIDPRLLTVLAQATAERVLRIETPAAPAGEEGLGTPRRTVQVLEIDGQPVVPGARPVTDLIRSLRAQPAPYKPRLTLDSREGGGSALTLTYDLPTPTGLLSPRGFHSPDPSTPAP